MRVKYKAENCEWMLFASQVEASDDSLVMKTTGHVQTCGWTFYHNRATSNFLARKYAKFLRLNKRVTLEEFREKVHSELNLHITAPHESKDYNPQEL